MVAANQASSPVADNLEHIAEAQSSDSARLMWLIYPVQSKNDSHRSYCNEIKYQLGNPLSYLLIGIKFLVELLNCLFQSP